MPKRASKSRNMTTRRSKSMNRRMSRRMSRRGGYWGEQFFNNYANKATGWFGISPWFSSTPPVETPNYESAQPTMATNYEPESEQPTMATNYDSYSSQIPPLDSQPMPINPPLPPSQPMPQPQQEFGQNTIANDSYNLGEQIGEDEQAFDYGKEMGKNIEQEDMYQSPAATNMSSSTAALDLPQTAAEYGGKKRRRTKRMRRQRGGIGGMYQGYKPFVGANFPSSPNPQGLNIYDVKPYFNPSKMMGSGRRTKRNTTNRHKKRKH